MPYKRKDENSLVRMLAQQLVNKHEQCHVLAVLQELADFGNVISFHSFHK